LYYHFHHTQFKAAVFCFNSCMMSIDERVVSARVEMLN
jgi:hypothetical protein